MPYFHQVCEARAGIAGTSTSWGLLGVAVVSVNEVLTTVSLLVSIIVGLLTAFVLIRKIQNPKPEVL